MIQIPESTNMLADVLESAPDAMIVTNNHGTIIIINSQTEKMFGYQRQELLGQKVEILVPSKFRDKHYGHRDKYNSAPKVRPMSAGYDLYAQHKDGSEFPVEISLSPMKSNDSTMVIAAIRDVSARKSAEKEIADLNQKLFKSARDAGMAEVASSVIHNIGNILNSMNVSGGLLKEIASSDNFSTLFNALKLLQSRANDYEAYLNIDEKGKLIVPLLLALYEPLQKHYNMICDEINNLNIGVHSIRDIVLAQQSLLKFTGLNEKINLTDIVQTTLKLVSGQLSGIGIAVLENYEDIPSILSDRSKLSQIFLNLMQNAKDALALDTENRNKQINISIKKSNANNNLIQVTVRDNGKGIAKEDLDKIFISGFTTKKDGHGLGLHSSAIYANELGGKLSVESDGIGCGAAFIFTVPVDVGQKVEII